MTYLRNKAYDFKFFKSYTPPVPAIVSVGNIVAGGTGKTPVTMLLSKNLVKKTPIAILSRGYRSHAENLSTPLRLSAGKGPEYPASFCGDEPYLLAENLPSIPIFVGKDRIQAAEMAAKQGAKIVILDDGMQHRKIFRDFDIVVLDAKDPFGQGHLLPRGLLREDVSSLKRASLVIINNVENKEQYDSIASRVAKYTAAPLVGTEVTIEKISYLDNNPVETLKNKKIGMFCGIGNPLHFKKTLQNAGAKIIAELPLADHACLSTNQMQEFAKQCKNEGADYIVCTEKDKVKLEVSNQLALPIVWVKIELEVCEGLQYWNEFIKKTVKQARK